MVLYPKLEVRSGDATEIIQTCFLWHLKAEKTLWQPRDLQSERSCHSSRSWRCQRPPVGGWHWWFDLPESPAKARAVLASEAWEFPTWESRQSLDSDCNNQTHLHFARSNFFLLLLPSNCNCCKVLDDTLGVHSLPCTRFSAVKDQTYEKLSTWQMKLQLPHAFVFISLLESLLHLSFQPTYSSYYFFCFALARSRKNQSLFI